MAEDDGDQAAIEQQIERAITSRIQHFKDQADSLTMESVRRLLEKDLGFEKFALDAHKRFIRHYLEKKMDGGDEYSTKTESEIAEKDSHLNKEEAAMLPKPSDVKNNLKKSSSGDEETMEDSPIMGVLTPKSEADAKVSPVNESGIKKAIWKRADHFLANSENITLAGVRRLLEEDLGLAKNTLDSFKKFISQEIDQVLNPPKVAKSTKDVKKKNSENVRTNKSKEISGDESHSSGSESNNEMEDKVKSRKKAASRRNVKKVEPTKKRKTSEREIDGSGKGSKPAKRQKGDDNESDVDGSLSEDGHQSPSSNEKSAQRKDKSTPAYGKRVENLKSIIKACGMSVAPSIYKKAKQVPENKREAFIVKELEDILSKEGLSKNPLEKDIKSCRKRKERDRELEGIDMGNIISSSRRRSTFSFTTPVKPEIRAKKEKVAAKESKSKDSNDEGQNNDNKEEEKNEENEKKENEKVEEKKDEGEGDDEEEEKKDEGEGDDEEEEVEEEEEDDDNDAEEDSEEDDEEEEESEEFNEDDSD